MTSTRCGFVLFTLLAAGAARVEAQNFLMNSAETINEGNFKIAAFPTLLFAEGDGDNEWGGAGRIGYGLSSSFDVEAKVAYFDGLKLYGADAEMWLVKGRTDVSVSGGAHRADFDGGGDSTAVDVAAVVSRSVGNRLEVYAGGSVSFEWLSDVDDSSFRRYYVVPGIEYRVAEDIDVLAEFGLGLNDESPNYFSVGVAYYVR